MKNWNQRQAGQHGEPAIDAGLLALRVGVGLSFVLLLSLKHAEAQKTFPGAGGRSWLLIVVLLAAVSLVLGVLTESAAAVLVLAWLWAGWSELRAGEAWFVLPIRAVEYAILCAALGIAGPGKYSLDRVLRHRPTENEAPSAT